MPDEGLIPTIKRAFTWHWNLLGLGAAVGFGILSGSAAVALPLIAAAELAYLGFLGLNPRFQNILRGQKKSDLDAQAAAREAQERYQKIMSFLPAADARRFSDLQQRCSALLDLRRRMDSRDSQDGIENFRGESLDRLLWLFLKLLHQKAGIERFLASTKNENIQAELKSAEQQFATAQERDKAAGGIESRLTTSIRERIETIRGRLDNHTKASESLELVAAELDKTQQQITHICEVGMTMRDSADLSAQIDSLSESLQSSEKTFSNASLGMMFDDETAPPLLSAPPITPPIIPPRMPQRAAPVKNAAN